MQSKKRKYTYTLFVILFFFSLLYLFSGKILTSVGEFLVVNEKSNKAYAVLVLNTGMEYYPRLIEAANIYNLGFAKKIVINGNRKTDVLKEIESRGFRRCCPWYEESMRILELYNVPRKDIITISAEDAYDTITEAKFVGRELAGKGIRNLILVTSKSHTRRARYIWDSMWSEEFNIQMVSAKKDPYDPEGWWKSGRQIKWVLSEYGAWVFYYLKNCFKNIDHSG